MANTGNTQQQIDYGISANDGTGDDLRVAFIKTDENFDNIWLAGPVGSNITITDNTIQVNNTNGNLILSPNGIGVIQTNSKLLPRLNNTYDLGSSTSKYRSVFVGAGGITNDGNLILNNVANLRIPGGENGYVIQTDGDSNLSWVAMPGAGNGSPGGANLQVQYNANGLFGGSTNFTFNPTTSNLTVGNAAVGNISTRTVFANTVSVSTGGNTWSINNQVLRAPTGATWYSNTATNDEFISSATNGYINMQTYDAFANLATQLHLEHGLVHVNITNGINLTWEFNDTGLFSAPGNIEANGNITGNYFLGDGSQLTNLPGGVIQGAIPPASPNDTTLWWDDITGRLYVWYDDGSGLQWVDAAPAAPAVTYGNANVALYTASGQIGNIIPGGNAVYSLGNATNQWSDLYVANATIYMNNVPIGLTAGNVLTVNGNDVVTANANGTVNLGNLAVDNNNIYNTQDQGVVISNFSFIAEAETAYVQIPAGNSPSDLSVVQKQGNVRLAANAAVWTFDTIGNLRLPLGGNLVGVTANNNGYITWLGNSSGDGAGYTTLGLIPDDTLVNNDQYLIIDPTAPGHIHIRAGGTQDNSSADLFLGGENSYFKVNAGANNEVKISANSHGWVFGADSTLTLPGEGVLRSIGDTVNLQSYNVGTGNVNSVYLGSGGGLGFFDQDIGGNWLEIFRSGAEPEIRVPVGRGNLNIQTAEGITPYNWTFDNTGNLTAPGNITAGTFVTPPVPLANLTAVAGARAFVSDGNLAAVGNFGVQVGGGAGNTVPVWSDGSNWYIG